jgi:uncharacterized caspase-like protein
MSNNWAIVVGVNHYEHHPERKLRYAVRDAQHLGDFLCQSAQFGPANVIHCLGEETRRGERNYPSCSNLFRILNRDLKPSNIGQVQHLWFFFSGHGISRNGRDFLVPSDCLEEDLDRFLLPVDEVIAALRLHQKAEIVLILDACREKIGSKGNGPTIGTQTVEFAKERGVTTIFSCGYGQLSYELEALQQGAFTHALVEGLGKFTLPFQLEPFLVQRVNELHRESRKAVEQTPKIQTDSTAKAFQSLLPDCVTSRDVTFLIGQATEAELEERFDDARNWLRQVIEVAPLPSQRREALKAQDRIESKIARRRVTPELAEAFQQYNIHLEPGATYIAPPVSLAAEKIQYNVNLEEGSTFVPPPETVSRQPTVPEPQNAVDTVPLESETGINYCKLRDLLKDGKWEEADRETLAVMLQAANRKSDGWLDENSLKKFPCKDLRTIDQLWVLASNGHFGFSVQKKIWEECGSPLLRDDDWDQFCVRVGWQNQGKYVNYCDYKKDLSFSPIGELPRLNVLEFCLCIFGLEVAFSFLAPRLYISPIVAPASNNLIDTVALESEKGIDYLKLRDLLKDGKWEEADRETLAVMLQAANRKSQGWLDSDSLKKFPCKDLRTIDQLWVAASNGHFGFSVQKKIWEECSGPILYGDDWEKFGDRVGWRQQGDWKLQYSDLKKNLELSPAGEFPLWWVLFGFVDGLDDFCWWGFLAQRLVECSMRQS